MLGSEGSERGAAGLGSHLAVLSGARGAHPAEEADGTEEGKRGLWKDGLPEPHGGSQAASSGAGATKPSRRLAAGRPRAVGGVPVTGNIS